jgi:hypothetical protein
MYADEYFNNNTWIWDGKPHWAYNTEYMIPVSDRAAIEWSPNTIDATVKIEGNKAHVTLTSTTPNLKAYQMKAGDNSWRDVPASVTVPLESGKDKHFFRTINLAGVPGPEYKLNVNDTKP